MSLSHSVFVKDIMDKLDFTEILKEINAYYFYFRYSDEIFVQRFKLNKPFQEKKITIINLPSNFGRGHLESYHSLILDPVEICRKFPYLHMPFLFLYFCLMVVFSLLKSLSEKSRTQ